MENSTKIDPYGFREYDARWLYKKNINLLGIEHLGKGLGTQIVKHTKKNNPRVIIGLIIRLMRRIYMKVLIFYNTIQIKENILHWKENNV